ncbi:hypothetical protein GCM10010911_05100 [Paenibacillus nasutitermitis]|uniref:Uncharacterized protein n=1 Tax=Paenibacillus nasutitermitis TaxID=1652958 RepID=A0A916YM85_9BACL|nr:hypothetical protein GCM10010911_05100 [Paenibacillus nasutitermitis]
MPLNKEERTILDMTHFFPLAPLFQVSLYHYTGVLLCLIATITWLFVPEEITMGGYPVLAYMSVVGLGSALVLWGTGLAIWLMGKRLLNDGRESLKRRRV